MSKGPFTRYDLYHTTLLNYYAVNVEKITHESVNLEGLVSTNRIVWTGLKLTNRYHLIEDVMADILSTKEIIHHAALVIPKGMENAVSISIALRSFDRK